MSYNKIKFLQLQQKELRSKKSNVPTLKVEQEVLTRGLLSKKKYEQKETERLRQNQNIIRDLKMKREREKQMQRKAINEVAKKSRPIRKHSESISKMFFPNFKKRKMK